MKPSQYQRIYGIAFPDKAMLKKWVEFQEQAKLRDHRTVGVWVV
jgi:threonyl-tRNA synthetase